MAIMKLAGVRNSLQPQLERRHCQNRIVMKQRDKRVDVIARQSCH
jgi:hypothetical protein